MQSLSLVGFAAINQHGHLGKKDPPWEIPFWCREDRKIFQLTIEKRPMIMGWKTFQSMKKHKATLYPDNLWIVITHHDTWEDENVIGVRNLEKAKNICMRKRYPLAVIAGGRSLYQEVFVHSADLDGFFLTRVEVPYPDVEIDIYTKFPASEFANWLLARDCRSEKVAAGFCSNSENPYAITLYTPR